MGTSKRGTARAAGLLFEPYPQAEMVRDLERFGVTSRRTLFGRRYLVRPEALYVAMERAALHGAVRAKVFLSLEAAKHGRQVVSPTDLNNLANAIEYRAGLHDVTANAALAGLQVEPFAVRVENALAAVVGFFRKPFVALWGKH